MLHIIANKANNNVIYINPYVHVAYVNVYTMREIPE